jgi:hypothetical protein
MNTEFPQSLPAYFESHPDQFAKKNNIPKKAINGILFLAFLVLIIYPEITPVGELWIWRVIAWIGMGFAGISLFLASDYYKKQTQTKIKQKGHKKFDSGHTTVEELSRLLEQGNYQELANLPSKNNQPLQMYVYEDTQNKTFYLLLMKYFSPSDFRGVTPVKVVSGADYDHYKMVIRAIDGY